MNLAVFTTREDQLIHRLRQALMRSGNRFALETYLGERLWNWRLWIGDSAIYLNELKNVVEATEKKYPYERKQVPQVPVGTTRSKIRETKAA